MMATSSRITFFGLLFFFNHTKSGELLHVIRFISMQSKTHLNKFPALYTSTFKGVPNGSV